MVKRAIEMQKHDGPTAPSKDPQPPKSAAQLRLQALGALLSLAPHNIRYEELVAEGINPGILKRLYEEVGIKIAPAGRRKTPAAGTADSKPLAAPDSEGTTVSSSQSASLQKPAVQNKPVLQKPAVTTSEAATPVASQSDSSKPMERKELIAQMLAAKAAKAAESPGSKAIPKEAQPPASTTIKPSDGNDGKTNGVPVREKNKAQTELARQRIEELRRQALLKKQQQSQTPDQPDRSTLGDQPSASQMPAVQHPLPVRPPIPQAPEASSIPGLFMTGSHQTSAAPPPAGPTSGITVDSTPVTRTTQRKRPRASDFDEPVGTSKKHSNHAASHPGAAEKLIIDISDDESLYGDDEGGDMDVDSSPEQAGSPVGSLERPSLQKRTSDTGVSTSTPQGTASSTGQDTVRQRDLEIQAMYRKIAELEQKRRAKLAVSRTQSPRTVEDSGASSSAAHSNFGDTEAAEASTVPSSGPNVASVASATALTDRSNLIKFFSGPSMRVLASMDLAQLEGIRLKILQMKEIEARLSNEDADIQSSESRLSSCKKEAEDLLTHITQGQEACLLLEELKKFVYDNGLWPEDLGELHRQAGIEEQHLAAKQGMHIIAQVQFQQFQSSDLLYQSRQMPKLLQMPTWMQMLLLLQTLLCLCLLQIHLQTRRIHRNSSPRPLLMGWRAARSSMMLKNHQFYLKATPPILQWPSLLIASVLMRVLPTEARPTYPMPQLHPAQHQLPSPSRWR